MEKSGVIPEELITNTEDRHSTGQMTGDRREGADDDREEEEDDRAGVEYGGRGRGL